MLRANERSEVLDAIETHLRYEPEKGQQESDQATGRTGSGRSIGSGSAKFEHSMMYSSLREGGVVEVLAIREKNEAMKWLAEYRENDEMIQIPLNQVKDGLYALSTDG